MISFPNNLGSLEEMLTTFFPKQILFIKHCLLLGPSCLSRLGKSQEATVNVSDITLSELNGIVMSYHNHVIHSQGWCWALWSPRSWELVPHSLWGSLQHHLPGGLLTWLTVLVHIPSFSPQEIVSSHSIHIPASALYHPIWILLQCTLRSKIFLTVIYILGTNLTLVSTLAGDELDTDSFNIPNCNPMCCRVRPWELISPMPLTLHWKRSWLLASPFCLQRLKFWVSKSVYLFSVPQGTFPVIKGNHKELASVFFSMIHWSY